MRKLLIPAAILLFLAFRSGKKLYDNVQYSFKGLKLYRDQSDIFSGYFSTSLLITNPTNESFTFNSVVGTAHFNGNPVGNFQVQGPVTIVPNATITVPTKVTSNNKNVLVSLIQWISTKGSPDVKLTGTINTSLGAIPFDQSISYS